MTAITWKDIPERLLHGDEGWRGALWILIGQFSRQADVWRYVDLEKQSIFFSDMLAHRAWSSTETLLLETAYSLFDGEAQVSLYKLAVRLDSRQFATVIGAIAFSRNPDMNRALVAQVTCGEL